MATAVAIIIALVLLGACLLSGYYISALFTARDRLSIRWCGTLTVAAWLLTAIFYALVSISAFRIWIAIPLWLVLAGGLHATVGRRHGYSGLLMSDLASVWRLAHRPLPPRVALAVSAVAAVVALRTIRGLVAPPLTWDALTYHFVKAARWVQHGDWALETAPDAWSYYAFFPAGGDLLWAWAMLPAHSDALLGPAGLLVWLACVLAAYGSAVVLDIPRAESLLTALAIASMPCILGFLTSGHVMTFLLTQLLLAFAFIGLALQSRRLGPAVLATAALSVAAGVQASAWPMLPLGFSVLLVAVWRHHPPSRAWRTSVCCALVSALALSGYVHTWIHAGSPLYPLGLSLGGRVLASGNEQLSLVLSGQYLNVRPTDFVPLEFLVQLFTGPDDLQLEHLNLGPGAVGLALLGVAGVGPRLMDKRRRGTTLLLLALAAIPVAALLSDAMLAQRTTWVRVAGRFLVPTAAALALIGATVPTPVASWIRVLAVLGGAAYAIPQGISTPDWMATGQLALFTVAGALIVLLTRVVPWRRRRFGELAGAGVGLLVLSYGIETTRIAYRYPIYRATDGRHGSIAYDLHPLSSAHAEAWPIWAHVDAARPLRIAFVAGWNYVGHNWYRYPLLGRQLQNTVLYVPPTRDGRARDYQRMEQLRANLDLTAWVRRLLDERVDVVVVAPPEVPELTWMRKYPNVFVQTATGADGKAVAFQFIEAQAVTLLKEKAGHPITGQSARSCRLP
jgi:hypothetical protein